MISVSEDLNLVLSHLESFEERLRLHEKGLSTCLSHLRPMDDLLRRSMHGQGTANFAADLWPMDERCLASGESDERSCRVGLDKRACAIPVCRKCASSPCTCF